MSESRSYTNSFARLAVLVIVAARALAQEGTVDWEKGRTLHPGVRHLEVRVVSPRALTIDCVRVDARSGGLVAALPN